MYNPTAYGHSQSSQLSALETLGYHLYLERMPFNHTLILQVCTAEGKKHVANFKTWGEETRSSDAFSNKITQGKRRIASIADVM